MTKTQPTPFEQAIQDWPLIALWLAAWVLLAALLFYGLRRQPRMQSWSQASASAALSLFVLWPGLFFALLVPAAIQRTLSGAEWKSEFAFGVQIVCLAILATVPFLVARLRGDPRPIGLRATAIVLSAIPAGMALSLVA
jgi:uncharacterized membrane protein YdjX (TVP38/TMEM64 family)